MVTSSAIQFTQRRYSLIGGGDPVLAIVAPGGVLVQNLGPVWRPRHDVQPVTRLKRVLTPRPRLMLRLQERGGRLDAEQWAGTHENWETEVRRGGKQDVRKKGDRRKWGGKKSGKIVEMGRKWIDTWKMYRIKCSWCSKMKKREWREKERGI